MRARTRTAGNEGTSVAERELDVIRLVAKGLRNREIGKRLLITEGTVKIH